MDPWTHSERVAPETGVRLLPATRRARSTALSVAAALLLVACSAPRAGTREQLLAYLETEFRADAPGGVVLVADGSEVLVRRAFGMADLGQGRALVVQDSLPIGSVTKSFAAAAILRLVDEGSVRLSDDVRDHVGEAPTQGRRVTLEQLLTHTSGMPNLVDRPGFEEWARTERTTAELIAQTVGMDWLCEPGEAVHYSDSGYILLGAVVERVSGMAFDEYVVRALARPLGMPGTRSGHRPTGAEPLGYSAGELATPIHLSVAHAAGQLTSTVDDLLRWVRAWEAHEVCSRALSERAWSARVLPDGTVSGYGFGWKRDSLAGRLLVGHGGWIPGFTAGVVHLPEEGLTAIALVNTDDSNPEASYVARRCLRLLLTGSPFVATVEVGAQRRSQLVGRYRTASGALLSIEDPGAPRPLTATWGADGPLDLVALTGATFAVAGSDGTWRFQFEGSPTAVTVRTSLSGEPREVALRVAGASTAP